MAILLLVIGGALALEGFGWAVAPYSMRQAYRQMVEQFDTRQLSGVGLIALVVGLVMIIAAIAMLQT